MIAATGDNIVTVSNIAIIPIFDPIFDLPRNHALSVILSSNVPENRHGKCNAITYFPFMIFLP